MTFHPSDYTGPPRAPQAFCYGWNMPGYSPDTAETVEDWAGARDSLLWEIERWDTEGDRGLTDSALDTAAEKLKAAPEGSDIEIPCGPWVLFILTAEA